MTSPSDDHVPQRPADSSPQPAADPPPKRPHVVTRSPQPEESGFLISGWGTAFFLLIGLLMTAGLLAGSYWLITEAEVIAKSNVLGKFLSKYEPKAPPAPVLRPFQNPLPPQIPPNDPPAKPSRPRPRRLNVPFTPPRNEPLQELTSDEQAKILASLRPLESNDERTKDIIHGFSLESITASQNDPEDCQKMTEVISETLSMNGRTVVLQTDRFYHPLLLQRIREQLPPEILVRSKLHFELKYMARVAPQVRVVHVERYNGDTERTVYCHIGDHSDYAFRYELVRVRQRWFVVDMESIDTGLSLSEVVALTETLNVLHLSERSQLYANAIDLFNPHRIGDIQTRAASFRKYLMEKVPNPLRDFYLGVTANAEDRFWEIGPKAIKCVRDVEDPDRFLCVHRFRIDFARKEKKPHDVVTHAERYMARAGYACPHVVRSYAEALIQLNRVQDSVNSLEYLLTLDRKDEATIQLLAIATAASEVRKQLAPLLEKFELDELLIVPEPDVPNSPAPNEGEPETESQTPAPTLQ
ncbi:MAG: hypothetical protein U0929_19230 [Planctomycetaceae bacterium]